MQKKSYPDSLVPKYTFSEENQELLLKEDPIIKRMKKARNDKSKDFVLIFILSILRILLMIQMVCVSGMGRGIYSTKFDHQKISDFIGDMLLVQI